MRDIRGIIYSVVLEASLFLEVVACLKAAPISTASPSAATLGLAFYILYNFLFNDKLRDTAFGDTEW